MARFDILESKPYRLVFNSNEIENEYFFRSNLSDEVFNELGFKEYTNAGRNGKFFLSKPLKVDEIRSFGKNQKQSISVPEITVLQIEVTRVLEYRKELSEAMMSTFARADRIFLPFQNYVLAAASQPEDKILARLFHLAQSSGSGKTKLCLHLLKELNCGIYSVFRDNDSSGFPDSISWTDDLIKLFKNTRSDQDAVELCLAFICAALETFKSYDSKDPIKLYTNPLEPDFNELVEKFKTNFDNSKRENEGSLRAKIIALASDIPDGKCFPIVLDECHEFLCYPKGELGSTRINLYRAFRRAMILIKQTKVVAICLGTKSSLNDFVLNYRIDPSARPTENVKIINPYIFVHSFDVFFTGEINLFYKKLIQKKTGRFFNPETLQQVALNCGRPLWKAYGNYIKAFYGAAKKLAADTKIARLTAFVLRTGAPVVPSCELTHKLVLSGMALLQYVDVFGESCEVSYCPEPILSSAARLFAGSLDNLRIVLKQFLEYVDKRCVLDLGSSGEFVARIAILRAMDKLAEVPSDQSKKSNLFVKSIDDNWFLAIKDGGKCDFPADSQTFPNYAMFTLREFLTTLGNCTVGELGELKLSKEMLDGLVNVSQFVTVKREFKCDQLFLLHGFLRAVGFCLPTNWPGADLMIPVFRSDNRFSCVMVQVKNLDQLSIPGTGTNLSNTIINMMKHGYIKLDLSAKGVFETVPNCEFAKVIIQFAEQRTITTENQKIFKQIVPSATGKDRVLWILGLEGFKHLFTPTGASQSGDSNEIIKDLETILSGARDFVNRIDDQSLLKLESSQNTREGIRTLLNTSVPIQCSDYLSLHDPIYQKHYLKSFKSIEGRVKSHELSEQVNELRIICGDASTQASSVASVANYQTARRGPKTSVAQKPQAALKRNAPNTKSAGKRRKK